MSVTDPVLIQSVTTSQNYECIYLRDSKSSVKSRDRLIMLFYAVVVAQLVERSLPTPEIRGSNPVIG